MRDEKLEITTKTIKKALLLVLREISDICYNEGGESTSSAGSDCAPSEDNLEQDEIAEVVPELCQKSGLIKRPPVKKVPSTNDLATSISPLRRKTQVIDPINKRGS